MEQARRAISVYLLVAVAAVVSSHRRIFNGLAAMGGRKLAFWFSGHY
jgi:hypothetical protein